jgi:hypothetical protein
MFHIIDLRADHASESLLALEKEFHGLTPSHIPCKGSGIEWVVHQIDLLLHSQWVRPLGTRVGNCIWCAARGPAIIAFGIKGCPRVLVRVAIVTDRLRFNGNPVATRWSGFVTLRKNEG